MNNLKRLLCEWESPKLVASKLIEEWGEAGFIWLYGDGSELGRWVTLAVNPLEQFCSRKLKDSSKESNPFQILRELPPGHWTGWLSYEAASWIEPQNPWQSSSMATLWIASHDPVLKFDLQKKELWLEGQDQKRFSIMENFLNIFLLGDVPNDLVSFTFFIGTMAMMAASVFFFLSLDACLLYTSPSPRDRTRSRMPSSA